MGKACCGTPGVQTYQFNGKEQKIKIKDAKTIERFAAGGNARIQVKNKKIEMGKEIAGKYFFHLMTNKKTMLDASRYGLFVLWKN